MSLSPDTIRILYGYVEGVVSDDALAAFVITASEDDSRSAEERSLLLSLRMSVIEYGEGEGRTGALATEVANLLSVEAVTR
jgi:hypothetical protein